MDDTAPRPLSPEDAVAHVGRYRQLFAFPDPRRADSGGLVAWGGDLSPGRLLAAYESGIFPWYEREPILWFSPDPRWVLRPEALHVGRSLRRRERAAPYRLSADRRFEEVVRHCARTPRPGQAGTWINEDMIRAYTQLHHLGVAHSVEAWQDDALVGGLYGVSLGSAFFGESMFAHAPDASKLAFVALVRQLQRWDFALVDCQVHTTHLERFGAEPWRRERFLEALEGCLDHPTRPGPWSLDETGPGA